MKHYQDTESGGSPPSVGGKGGDTTYVKALIAMLLFFAPRAAGQPGPAGTQESSPAEFGESLTVEQSPAGLDSLERSLALLEIAKADQALKASGFWRRLVPHVSLSGSLGVRDIAFNDGTGSVVFPKDSYRLTFALSLSDLFDGSARASAEIGRAEAETRYLVLCRKQSLARRALLRKKEDLAANLAALREELAVRASLAAFQDLVFIQGRIDFRALSESKIELIRLKHSVAGLSSRLGETERLLAGAGGP